MAKKERKKSSFWADFKKFIARGNVVDLAVAVVIGGAFGKIVTGFVNYIINPFIGILVGEGSLDSIKTVIYEAVVDAEGVITSPEVAILWGTWLQTIIDFVIIALCIFIVIKIISSVQNRLNKKKLAEQAEADRLAKEQAEKDALAAKELADEKLAKEEALRDSLMKQESILADILTELKSKK